MYTKRLIDFLFSFLGLVILFPVIIFIMVGIKISDGSPIIFKQIRIGKYGRKFKIFKFRTMVHNAGKLYGGSVSTLNDHRITSFGSFLRKWKLDELPSLYNVFIGDMSLVGPRPDVQGYADRLEGDNKRIMSVLPGITGPATLAYANEECLLEGKKDPKKYNDEVIYPDKIRINLNYIDNWSLWLDIKIIFKTIFRRNY